MPPPTVLVTGANTGLSLEAAQHMVRLGAEDILQELAREDVARMVDRQVVCLAGLAERLTQPPNSRRIISSTINPGAVVTDIMRESKGFFSVYVKATQAILMGTAEEGSRTLVHAAKGSRETDGQYLCDCKPAGPELISPFVTSEEGVATQRKLWKELMDKLERIQPSIARNI
ncbi:hypothetical protein QBC33DRAFT_566215 [Phialemonium atrogriseum]|uniref:Uncharacterized protein n=1 Tax=Phialemonium atrogriseum TaxID=1093897 RepID=A0AAJ0C8M2_9PEZI|nr:uncharacterized protein QBC33DRAFT_566215 [Phialemonium atrogriseum]KAK1770737.1 hypothetical protein QBC33DRAFT_566215 [Phialemonium atrogriseum]